MWRELIEGVCPNSKFFPPASEEEIAEVEAALGVLVPEELRSLWAETNGFIEEYGTGIWSTERVIHENLELRSYSEQNDLYMSFESVFCFADAGNGDLFFFPIQADDRIHWGNVFVWDHEDDSRKWVTNNLQQFVERWFGGQLTI